MHDIKEAPATFYPNVADSIAYQEVLQPNSTTVYNIVSAKY